ncbi:hypothetical protein FOS14_18340 [Skermania sp. ID1734]|uniref:hypothetical protein n=1 Tax=Skermania sp. ID1734 TaxID=2597516 RepID=UPI00117FF625|nr:hypothetical protein [Skermania sp. ID1734]TSD95320.1 hypothetical protein FOS14_18340 [Skermania sp. ID1734]
MSRLAADAELVKLANLFGVDQSEVAFLSPLDAEPLRLLREAVAEHLLEEDRPLLRRLARIAERLPSRAGGWLATHISPVISAGIVVDIPARRGALLAKHVDPVLLADVCVHLDPRRARDLIQLLPVTKIVDIALELDSRDDFVTMSRFVDFLSDDTILAVEEAISDETRLLRIAFLMESKNRVDHIFRMLPSERIQRLLMRIQEDPEGLIAEFLSLLVHVSYGFKRELGDILAAQDDQLIDAYISAVDRRDLWADVLPVVSAMSPQSQERVVQLAPLRDEAVQANILRTADKFEMWGLVLPLVAQMGDENRSAVARIIAKMPESSMRVAVDAALIGEHWGILLNLVSRMPANKQAEFTGIVYGLGQVDPNLCERIINEAKALGIDTSPTVGASA